MRTFATFAVLMLCCPVIERAQVAPSSGLGCLVIAGGGMTCNGPTSPPTDSNNKASQTDFPQLLLTEMRLEAGATFDVRGNARSDYLIEGIDEGSLVNEKSPFRFVSLHKGSVILMPSGKPFRLRNKSSITVEFRVIEIRR